MSRLINAELLIEAFAAKTEYADKKLDYKDILQVIVDADTVCNIPDNVTNDKIIEKIRNINADNMSGNFVKALCIGFLMSERSDKE